MSRRTTIATLALALLAGPALAEPTAITIRAISHDGKFIGDSMGGVRVRLTEAASGRELAAGLYRRIDSDTNPKLWGRRCYSRAAATAAQVNPSASRGSVRSSSARPIARAR